MSLIITQLPINGNNLGATAPDRVIVLSISYSFFLSLSNLSTHLDIIDRGYFLSIFELGIRPDDQL